MLKLQSSGCIATALLVGLLLLALTAAASGTKQAGEIERIGVEEALNRVESGQALLVCAYDDAACGDKLLSRALLRSEFEKKAPTLDKAQQIIFYCG
jgi:hypothetical protein